MRNVSVVMCTFNGVKYIREQIESILCQTYPIMEIIIQDDGSKDGTIDIITEYKSNYPLIHFYFNTESHGVNSNFFSAIKRAKGDYIALSDQDDIWHKDKLEKQMTAIENKYLCSHKDNYISNDGSFIYNDDRERNVSLLRLIFSGLPGHSFVFSRKLLEIMPDESPLYKECYYDVAFSLAASAAESHVYVNEALIDFRRHSDALTYDDHRDSLPTLKNALNMIITCISNYKNGKMYARKDFDVKLNYLKSIKCCTATQQDIIKFLKMEMDDGLISFVKLQLYFISHTGILFQTPGWSFIKIIRSALYPLMQYYNYTKQSGIIKA